MVHSSWFSFCFISLGIIATTLTLALIAEEEKAKPSQADEAKLKLLCKERRAVLEEACNALHLQFMVGRRTADFILNACEVLLQSELDCAESLKERIAAHKKNIDHCKEIEKRTKASLDNGTDTVISFYKATISRIEAELALLDEEAISKPTAEQGTVRSKLLQDRK